MDQLQDNRRRTAAKGESNGGARSYSQLKLGMIIDGNPLTGLKTPYDKTQQFWSRASTHTIFGSFICNGVEVCKCHPVVHSSVSALTCRKSRCVIKQWYLPWNFSKWSQTPFSSAILYSVNYEEWLPSFIITTSIWTGDLFLRESLGRKYGEILANGRQSKDVFLKWKENVRWKVPCNEKKYLCWLVKLEEEWSKIIIEVLVISFCVLSS